MKVLISNIKINQGRREANRQKVSELAESIKEIGLINPITITADKTLIAGRHRIEAFKQLGYAEIEANVVTIEGLQAELAEIDENLVRNELHYIDRSRQLARRKEIYEELHPETKARNTKGHISNYKSSSAETAVEVKPSFVKDTAQKTDKSERVIHEELQIAKKIIPEVQEAIKEKDVQKTEALRIARLEPDKQKEVFEKIESKQANTIKQAINQVNKKEIKPVELPKGKFDVILADPPWRYDFSKTDNRAIENKYPSMELEDIKNIEVPSADNSVLFLWATAPKLIEALEIMKAWGFTYKTHSVWDKEIIGMGYWFRGQHELLLVGTKGKASPPLPENRECSVFREKRTEHSKKPVHYYELIERMLPSGKYLELFSRNKFNDKWTVWGNQCE